MKGNIPLNTVEKSAFKQFSEKYTGKKTPSQSQLRKTYLPNLCKKSLTTTLQSFPNTSYYLIVDKLTYPCSRRICAGLVGKLNSEEKPIAIDVAELYDTNHRSIVQCK